MRGFAAIGVVAMALVLAGCPGGGDQATNATAATVSAATGTSALNADHASGAVSAPLPGAPAPEAPIGAPVARANIGVNTDWVCYWCTAQPFVDMVRQSSGFADLNTGASLAQLGRLDRDGWPMSDFRWMIVCCLQADGSKADPGPATPLGGDYQLSFTGQATLHPLSITVTKQHYDAATNTTTATLTIGENTSNFMLNFGATKRTAGSPEGSGVTDIKVIRPQYAPNGTKWWDSPDQEFTDPFLASFKGFSTIRYMNWTGPIGSPEVNWSDRTPANWPVPEREMRAAAESLPYLVPYGGCTVDCDWYTTKMSWESAIDLSNATHTDMWINIPTLATDDYVKNLAALIQRRLDPDLHVYVEWSDEIWNYGNPYWTETNYNNDQLTALLGRDPVAVSNYQNYCVDFADFECHVAQRTIEFGQDFASVYGRGAIGTTIRPVLCGQVVQPVMIMEALRFVAQVYGPPSKHLYGICGAPYFATALKDPGSATVDDVVAATNAGIPDNASYIETYTALSILYGLRSLSYEGGTALPAMGASGALQAAANLAPGMGASVTAGLTDFFRRGGDMYMYYSAMGSGGWGATNDQLNLDAPRYAALRGLAGVEVTRAAGTELPGTVLMYPPAFALLQGTAVPTYQMLNCWTPPEGNTSPSGCSYEKTIAVGNGYAYLVTVPRSATYRVSLDMPASRSDGALELELDGKSVGSYRTSAVASGVPAVAPLTVELSAGVHLVTLANASATTSATVHAIVFSAS